MRPTGVHHLAIKSTDPERLAGFYRDVLGLPVLARHTMPDAPDAVRSIWLSCGEAVLMVERAGRAGPAPLSFEDDPPGLHLLALRIDAADRAAWREALTRAGHAPVHETPWTLYVLDPDGNRVGLSAHDGGGGRPSAPPARSAS